MGARSEPVIKACNLTSAENLDISKTLSEKIYPELIEENNPLHAKLEEFIKDLTIQQGKLELLAKDQQFKNLFQDSKTDDDKNKQSKIKELRVQFLELTDRNLKSQILVKQLLEDTRVLSKTNPNE